MSDEPETAFTQRLSGTEPPGASPGGDGFGPRVPLDNFGADSDDSGFPPNRPGAPKPHILAAQANEWSPDKQEFEVGKKGRTGLILLFLLALLLVILIALGLALWSVFRSGDDVPEASGTETSVAADQDGSSDAEGDGGSASSLPSVETTLDPNALQVDITEEPFICDSGRRAFAQLSGASPNEEISFSSPQATGLANGTADANGALPINWSCDPDQAGTTWELTATGVTSGKAATFIFAGAVAGETTTVPGAAPAALTVVLNENPFACNSERRSFARLSGADPDEEITFSSPQATGLANGTADADGELSINWFCDPEQAGTSWDVTATGVTSGRSATLSFSGS